jgi:hypothetical protein
MLLVVVLLQEEVRTRREEDMRRLLCGDGRDDVAVLGAQSTQHVQDLTRLAHWLADVVESIGKLLEAAGVLGDVHIALD